MSHPPSSEAARVEAQNSRFPLVFQRRFWPLWSALFLGSFADNMLRQALIIGLSFGAIAAPGMLVGDDAVPVIGSLFAIAMLVFSSISGQIADKVETSLMFRRTKLAEIGIMVLAAIGFLLDSGLILIISLFIMGAQSAFYSPARMGAMPKYYSSEELIRANGICNAGLFVSILLGLFLGGTFIAAPGGGRIVAIFLLSAASLGFLASLFSPPAKANAPELVLDWNMGKQTAAIFSYAFKAPGVWRPLVGTGLFWFLTTLVSVLTPFYARDALGADEAVATSIMGFFAIGAGLGAIGAALLSKKRSGLGFSAVAISAAAIMSVLIVAMTGAATKAGSQSIEALLSSTPGLILCSFFGLSSALMGLFIVPLQAATQRRAPAEIRSRIMAASNMINGGAAMLGSLSVLFVTSTPMTPTQGFLAVAALQGLIAAYMIYRRYDAPDGLYDEGLIK